MATAFVGQERDPRLVLAVMLVVAGIGFKIAAVPFHMWAPDVYEGAPTPVTAFLSVGSKAASFAMLLRIFIEGMPSMSADWRLLFEALAVVTMTVGNLAALTQTNLKRMLAYSSIAHAGYLLIGVVAGTPRGVTAMLIYLLIYAFMQLGAFMVIIMMRREDVVGDELKDFAGLYLRHPLAAFAMLLFMLSLGGIPPTAGFMGKFWLFGAAIDAGYVWLALIGVLNSAISLYYYIRLVVFMYLKQPGGGSEPKIDSGGRVRAGPRRRRDAPARRLSGPAVRGGRSIRAHARRGGSDGRDSLTPCRKQAPSASTRGSLSKEHQNAITISCRAISYLVRLLPTLKLRRTAVALAEAAGQADRRSIAPVRFRVSTSRDHGAPQTRYDGKPRHFLGYVRHHDCVKFFTRYDILLNRAQREDDLGVCLRTTATRCFPGPPRRFRRTRSDQDRRPVRVTRSLARSCCLGESAMPWTHGAARRIGSCWQGCCWA